MKRTIAAAVLAAALVLPGCFENDDEYTLNPDGSGKVVFKHVLPAVSGLMGGEGSGASLEQARAALVKLIRGSQGVEAWKDLSYTIGDDSRGVIGGTAYFRDIEKLKLGEKEESGPFDNIKLTRGADGSLVVTLEEKEPKSGTQSQKVPAPAPEMTEEEIAKAVATMRAEYQAQRPMMEMMLGSLRLEARFHVPGKIETVQVFKRESDSLARLAIEGKMLLEANDQVMKDETLIRQAIAGRAAAGGDPASPLELALKNVFGGPGPAQIVVSGVGGPLFDYSADISGGASTAAALDSLEPKKPAGTGGAGPSPTGTGMAAETAFARIGLNRIEVEHPAGAESGGGQTPGISIHFSGELPERVAKAEGDTGRLLRAVATNGEDLLPESDFARQVRCDLAGESTVPFSVRLAYPGPGVTGIADLAGYVECSVSAGVESVDLGFEQLAADARGTRLESRITGLKPSEGTTQVTLEFTAPWDAVSSVSILDGSGKKLDVVQSSRGSHDRGRIVADYVVEGELPKEARVVVELYAGLRTVRLPFALENVDLIGRPLPGAARSGVFSTSAQANPSQDAPGAAAPK